MIRLLALLTLLFSGTIYVPLVTMGHEGAQPAPPASTDKRACGGCTCNMMAQLGVDLAYSWHPKAQLCEGGAVRLGLVKKPDLLQDAIPTAAEAGWLLMYNEPDLEGQSAHAAAIAYPEAEALGCKLALTTGSHLDGSQAWVKTFRNAYQLQYGHPPRIDALAAHCYFDAGPGTVALCKSHFENVIALAREWGVNEVWATEFGCVPGLNWSIRQCMDASEGLISWLESEPMITKYFWFAAWGDPQWHGDTVYPWLFFFNKPQNLTEWGKWYRNL